MVFFSCRFIMLGTFFFEYFICKTNAKPGVLLFSSLLETDLVFVSLLLWVVFLASIRGGVDCCFVVLFLPA